jgi:hypothetical protein
MVGTEQPGVCIAVRPLIAAAKTWSCGQPTGDSPLGLMFADVNLDGNLDALSTDADEPVVAVALGNGEGKFGMGPNLVGDCGYATQGLAVADLNGDGIPDVVATELGAGTAPGCIAVFLGQGNGEFAPAREIGSGGISPFSVAVGDLNNDGIPDLVVANWGSPFQGNSGNVSVLLGKGEGTFQPPVSYSNPRLIEPFQVTLADFNGDGNLDLVVVATGNKAIFVALGKGNGGFFPPTVYKLPENVGPIVVADFNGDGKLDLAAVSNSPQPPFRGVVGVMLGNGDGTFQPPELFHVDVLPTEIAVGDFNGDGRPDMAVLGGAVASISILLNTTTPWPGKGK